MIPGNTKSNVENKFKVLTIVLSSNEGHDGAKNFCYENAELNKYLDDGYYIKEIKDVTPPQSVNISQVIYILEKRQ